MVDDEDSEDEQLACPFCGGGRCDHLLLEVDDYDSELKGGHVGLFEHVVRGRTVDVYALIKTRWNAAFDALGEDPDPSERRDAFEELLDPVRCAVDSVIQFDVDALPGMSWTPTRFYVSDKNRAAAINSVFRAFSKSAEERPPRKRAEPKKPTKRSRARKR